MYYMLYKYYKSIENEHRFMQSTNNNFRSQDTQNVASRLQAPRFNIKANPALIKRKKKKYRRS